MNKRIQYGLTYRFSEHTASSLIRDAPARFDDIPAFASWAGFRACLGVRIQHIVLRSGGQGYCRVVRGDAQCRLLRAGFAVRRFAFTTGPLPTW